MSEIIEARPGHAPLLDGWVGTITKVLHEDHVMSYMWLTWQAEDELVSPSSPPLFPPHNTPKQTLVKEPDQGTSDVIIRGIHGI